MRRPRLLHQLLLLGLFASGAVGDAGKACSTQILDGGCPETETCVLTEQQTVGVCVCLPGYNRTGDDVCVRAAGGGEENVDAQGHPWAWTLSTLILIAIVIVGVYVTYKLRVVEWLRCKLGQRYNRSYDDVMIGQDDD